MTRLRQRAAVRSALDALAASGGESSEELLDEDSEKLSFKEASVRDEVGRGVLERVAGSSSGCSVSVSADCARSVTACARASSSWIRSEWISFHDS